MHVLALLAAEDDAGSGAGGLVQIGILLLIPLAMYFLMIRPQRRRMREQQAMQSALEVGDEVMTDRRHLRLHHRLRGRHRLGGDRRRRADPRQPRLAAGQGPHRDRRVRAGADGRQGHADRQGRQQRSRRTGRTRRTRRPTPTPPSARRRNDPPPPLGVVARLRRRHVRPAGDQPRRSATRRPSASTCRAASPSCWRPESGATGDDLLVIRDLIRDELENRGIGEPDVRVEGSNIVVDLPGVKDQRDALDAVDVAGIVTLRPVYQCFGAARARGAARAVPGSTVPGSTPRRHGRDRHHADDDADGRRDVADDRAGDDHARRPASAAATCRRAELYARPQSVPPTDAAGDDRRRPSATRRARRPASTVPATSIPTTGTTVPATTPETTVLRTIDGGQCVVGPRRRRRRRGLQPRQRRGAAHPGPGLDGHRRPQRRRRGGLERPRRGSATTAPRRARRGSWPSSSTTSSSRSRR